MTTATAAKNAARSYTVTFEGETFQNVTAIELDFLKRETATTHVCRSLFGRKWFVPIADAAAMNADAETAAAAHELADAAAADAVATVRAIPAPPKPPVTAETAAARIAIRKNDKPWTMDAAALMDVYGLEKVRRACTFSPVTVAGIPAAADGEVTRELVYKHVATGAWYAQYCGAFWAIPESCIAPETAPVNVKHATPETAAAPVKNDKPRRRYEWVSFNYGGNTYARKINRAKDGAETVNHDSQIWPLDVLDNVSKHYTKDAAQKRVAQERKNAKRADKLTRKVETPRNANGCKHIPETYNGAPVDVQAANVENVDTAAKWVRVTALVDQLTGAGIPVACIVYERDFAWVCPVDRSEEYAKKHHMAVNFSAGVGHSMKERRRAWFVNLAK